MELESTKKRVFGNGNGKKILIVGLETPIHTKFEKYYL